MQFFVRGGIRGKIWTTSRSKKSVWYIIGSIMVVVLLSGACNAYRSATRNQCTASWITSGMHLCTKTSNWIGSDLYRFMQVLVTPTQGGHSQIIPLKNFFWIDPVYLQTMRPSNPFSKLVLLWCGCRPRLCSYDSSPGRHEGFLSNLIQKANLLFFERRFAFLLGFFNSTPIKYSKEQEGGVSIFRYAPDR
jgi:hypothetical protein